MADLERLAKAIKEHFVDRYQQRFGAFLDRVRSNPEYYKNAYKQGIAMAFDVDINEIKDDVPSMYVDAVRKVDTRYAADRYAAGISTRAAVKYLGLELRQALELYRKIKGE